MLKIYHSFYTDIFAKFTILPFKLYNFNYECLIVSYQSFVLVKYFLSVSFVTSSPPFFHIKIKLILLHYIFLSFFKQLFFLSHKIIFSIFTILKPTCSIEKFCYH